MMATVIKNTTIVTGGPGRTILHDSAIAIEDGKIAALGNSEEVGARFPGAEVVDGRRKAVFPGLINAHTHLLKTANRGILEDTGFPTTLRFPEDTRSLMGKEEDNVFAVLGVIESIRSGATCVLEIEKDIANYAENLSNTGMRMVLAEYVEDVDMDLVRRSEYSFIPAKAEEGMRKSVELIEGWNGGAEGRVTWHDFPVDSRILLAGAVAGVPQGSGPVRHRDDGASERKLRRNTGGDAYKGSEADAVLVRQWGTGTESSGRTLPIPGRIGDSAGRADPDKCVVQPGDCRTSGGSGPGDGTGRGGVQHRDGVGQYG